MLQDGAEEVLIELALVEEDHFYSEQQKKRLRKQAKKLAQEAEACKNTAASAPSVPHGPVALSTVCTLALTIPMSGDKQSEEHQQRRSS